jgi:hypothetical protein
MPLRIPCPYCRRIGFVRLETVIKGSTASFQYYCGSCERTWQGDSPELSDRDDADAPKRRGS